MRDNHEGMPEIVDAYERDGLYFGVVRVHSPSASAAFEFGVEREGHLALRRILESRPFGSLPGLKHAFYFTGDYGRETLDQEPVRIGIRVEERMSGKKLFVDSPTTLASVCLRSWDTSFGLAMRQKRETQRVALDPAVLACFHGRLPMR